ncbi:hypothetical protein AB4516_15730 [Vibrio sp. 10N.222.54.F12]|uniref:hypothetical protein n=1 Tax=Vibrio sp. 10N.222.54.F12 TaxID=3229644 RepID=UPI0035537D02
MSTIVENPRKQLKVIMINDRFFYEFGKKGQVLTALSIGGARTFTQSCSLNLVLKKLDEKKKQYTIEQIELVQALDCWSARDVFKLRYRLERMAANAPFYDLTLCFRKAKRNIVEETAITTMQMMKAEQGILKSTAARIDKYIACYEYVPLPYQCLDLRLFNYKNRKHGISDTGFDDDLPF